MSCCRAPALMRMIHSFRKSRFLFLRSRYAYFHPRSTFSLAAFQSLERAPNPPRAAFMIPFFRFRRTTFDLTRGMGVSLRLNEALDALLVTRRRDRAGAARMPLLLGCLLGQDVAPAGLPALHLAGCRHLEALLRALVRLHLHRSVRLTWAPGSASCSCLRVSHRSRSSRCPPGLSPPGRARPCRARDGPTALRGTSWSLSLYCLRQGSGARAGSW